MGEIIAIVVAIVIYLLLARYINYIISFITLILPGNVLVIILLAISVSVILFIIHRKWFIYGQCIYKYSYMVYIMFKPL